MTCLSDSKPRLALQARAPRRRHRISDLVPKLYVSNTYSLLGHESVSLGSEPARTPALTGRSAARLEAPRAGHVRPYGAEVAA